MTITFYDLACTKKDVAWNPNTLKVRIALNYKGLPFETEWLEYLDIEAVVKNIGGAPTSKKPDGRDHYTLPVIHDSASGRAIADSAVIVAYLDENYPDTAPLFPKDIKEEVESFEGWLIQNVAMPLFFIALPDNVGFLNLASSEYFRQTREAFFKKKMEEMAPLGSPERAGYLAGITAGLTELGKFYDKHGPGKPFVFGDTFTFADAVVIAMLAWVKIVCGPESDCWKVVVDVDGGRWDKLVEEKAELCAV